MHESSWREQEMLDDRLENMKCQKKSLLEELEECRKELMSARQELGNREEELKQAKMNAPKGLDGSSSPSKQLNKENGRNRATKDAEAQVSPPNYFQWKSIFTNDVTPANSLHSILVSCWH